MLKLKIRYQSASQVHAANSTPGVMYTSPIPPYGFYCHPGGSHSETRKWLANYEELEYERGDTAVYKNCRHTTFRNVPKSIQSFDTWTGTRVGIPYGGDGSNIGSYHFETAFPHGDRPWAPQGAQLTKGLTEDDKMGGPMMFLLDQHDQAAIDLDAVGSSALKLVYTRFVDLNKLSLLNFLVELKDISRMIKTLKGLSIAKGWSSLASMSDVTRDFGKNVANYYLEYQFGYSPLVRDIISIMKALADWRKQLKFLLERVHRLNYAGMKVNQWRVPIVEGGFSDVFDYYGSSFCDSSPDYMIPAGRVGHIRKTEIIPRASIKYCLLCENLSKMNVELRALLDTFGVRWDPAIIWNAIPFSFIVDWIWDVSDFLDKWAKPNLPVKLRIYDFCITWKYAGTAVIETDHLGGTDVTTTMHTVRTNMPYARFNRVRFEPDLDHLKRANWDENVVTKTLLGASLITTKAVSVPPVRQRRFGPSNLSLRSISRKLGWTQSARWGPVNAHPALRGFYASLRQNQIRNLGHRLTKVLFKIERGRILD